MAGTNDLSQCRVLVHWACHSRTKPTIQVTSVGTIFVCGASDFSHFFDMAACPNHTTTSSYRCVLGLTKRFPTIRTQTFSHHNIKYHGYGKYSLTDVHGLRDLPHFVTQQHADAIQKNITLPYFSGNDAAVFINSNAILPPKQHIKHGVARLTSQ